MQPLCNNEMVCEEKKEIENKMLASIIDQLLQFFASLGYFGVALALMIEIIPSEIVLSYAGFLVADGKISFVGAVIAGTIGGTLAQIFYTGLDTTEDVQL